MSYNWDYLDSNAYNNRSGYYKFRTQLNFITKHIGFYNKNVLDVAGGSGRFAIPLLNHSEEVTVVDINERAISLLQERSEKIKTICGDFMQTDFSNTYSAIICIEAMCYFPDLRNVFLKISTLVDKGAPVIFTYTNTGSWRFFMRKIKGFFSEETDYFDVSFEELEEILTQNRFEIEAIEGMNWIPLPLNSDSILVNTFSFIEKKLNLKKWQSQSPWLLIMAKRI